MEFFTCEFKFTKTQLLFVIVLLFFFYQVSFTRLLQLRGDHASWHYSKDFQCER